MAQFGSPLKLFPSSAKRSKPSIDWNQCIICQCKSLEQLYVFTDRIKETFTKAAEVRQDEVYRQLIEEVSSITRVVSESFVVKYHRSCCKSYTSKQNITCFAQKKTTKEVPDSKSSSTVVCSNDITTRSDWTYCIFCKKKSYKKDHKLHKIESQDRMKKILDAARRNSDYEIESKVLHEQFYDKALYHNGCICKYFMKTLKETVKEETESSDHDLAFEKLISDINSDLMVNHKAFLMSTLLEKYRALLPEERADKYTSQKLQNRLLRHYGESIIIQSQQGHGRSNIVFSSSVSIGDAINTASQLKSDLKVAQMTLQMDEAKQAHTDDQFLHTAANILRCDIRVGKKAGNTHISQDGGKY